jgi:predicted transcriptional regulator of viral defense system
MPIGLYDGKTGFSSTFLPALIFAQYPKPGSGISNALHRFLSPLSDNPYLFATVVMGSFHVGWLSAAELLGASHHAPQVFQVAVSRPVRNRLAGRASFRFYHRSNIKKLNTILIESRNGMVPVSSRETSLLDIANDVLIAGGIDNAANLIIELCEASLPSILLLVELSQYYPAAGVRRLGWLLESFTETKDLDDLRETLYEREAAASLLDPSSAEAGVLDMTWNLKINRKVDPDR